jgi:hypothetical protein
MEANSTSGEPVENNYNSGVFMSGSVLLALLFLCAELRI